MHTLTIVNGDIGLSIFPHPSDPTVFVVYFIDVWSLTEYEPFHIPAALIEKLLEVSRATR